MSGHLELPRWLESQFGVLLMLAVVALVTSFDEHRRLGESRCHSCGGSARRSRGHECRLAQARGVEHWCPTRCSRRAGPSTLWLRSSAGRDQNAEVADELCSVRAQIVCHFPLWRSSSHGDPRSRPHSKSRGPWASISASPTPSLTTLRAAFTDSRRHLPKQSLSELFGGGAYAGALYAKGLVVRRRLGELARGATAQNAALHHGRRARDHQQGAVRG
jgi:hypothetical protein